MYFVAKPNEEAKAFIQAAGLTDETQCRAVGTLVFDLKNYGLWDKMKAIYPFVGQPGVSSSFQFNLKDPNTFKGIFTGSWTFSFTGATPDGTTGYMDTNFTPTSNGLTWNQNHISLYSRTNTSGTIYDIGMGGDIFASKNYALFLRRTGDSASYDSGLFPNNRTTFTNTNSQGFYLGSSLSGLANYYKNGISQASKSLTTSANFGNFNAYVGGLNEANTNKFYSNKEVALASFGDGLTDTEAANFYTAVQRFQTTLGRQV